MSEKPRKRIPLSDKNFRAFTSSETTLKYFEDDESIFDPTLDYCLLCNQIIDDYQKVEELEEKNKLLRVENQELKDTNAFNEKPYQKLEVEIDELKQKNEKIQKD